MIAAPLGLWRLVRPHHGLLAIAFAAMVVESAAEHLGAVAAQADRR